MNHLTNTFFTDNLYRSLIEHDQRSSQVLVYLCIRFCMHDANDITLIGTIIESGLEDFICEEISLCTNSATYS